MAKRLRVLIVEDSADDTLLIKHALKRGGYAPVTIRVDTAEAMAAALDKGKWDIAISDLVMPRFSGFAAIEIIQRRGTGLPLIMVSGKAGEDTAVSVMKAGANDYILKQNLSRLVPAIERELKDAELRRDKLKSEGALRELTERYRALIENTSDWIWETDKNFVYTYSSPKVADLLGYTPEEVVGKTPFMFMPPDEAKRLSRKAGTLSASRKPIDHLENTLIRKDGRQVVVETCGVPIIDATRRFCGYRGIDRDITGRKSAEEQLRARETQQAALAELGQRALTGLDIPRLFDDAVSLVAETLGVELCKVLELQPDDDKLLLMAGVGWKEGLVGSATVGAGKDSQAGYTLMSNNPVVVEDLSSETRFSGPPLLHDHGVVSGMSVVIAGRDRPYGVLGAHTASRRAFSKDDAHFLLAVANVLAEAIERKHNEESLARSTRLYRALSDVNQMLVRVRDRDTVLKEACRIAVEDGLLRMAWAGMVDEKTRLVKPVAMWGHVKGYLDNIRISIDDVPEGRGPTGTAIRTGKHFICAEVENDPRMEPWRKEALKRGYRSVAAFPITVNGCTVGAFNVYSDNRLFSDDDEVKLLDELAGDISFAFEIIGQEEKRRHAEKALKNEVEVSTALLKAAEVTSAYMNWDEIVEKVLALLKKLVSCESASVFMLEEGALVPKKLIGSSDGVQSFFYTIRPRLDEVPALVQVMNTRQPLVAGEREVSALFPEYFVRYLEMSEAIIAPVLARDKVAGFLGANFTRLPDDPRTVKIVLGIAGQMGVAYESSSLYEETQKKGLDLAKKMEAITVLHEIDRMILSTLNRDEMLSRVVRQVKRLIPADFGGVAMLEPDGSNFRFVCGWRLDMVEGALIPAHGCPALSAFKSQKALMRANLAEESISASNVLDKAFRDAGAKSDMFVPIISKGVGVGFMRLGSSRVAGFSLDDIAAAEKITFQIGIALENTRLISDLEDMLVNTVKALAAAIDAKSPWTKGHSERVTEYAVRIAEVMGLPEQDIEKLRLAGLLHDIGKLGTFDVILDKPGRLTDGEFDLVKKHPDRGCEILSPIKQFRDLLPVIRYHHERWDGSGYPAGLKGEDIPLMARILCVADSYDSMTADRPYRPAPGNDFAIAEFRRCSGSQFDKKVVEAFLHIIQAAQAA